MIELRGLPGVKDKMVLAYQVSSVTNAEEELKYHRAVTAAGDCGAINAWRDDDGNFRAEFHRRLSTVSRTVSPSKRGLRIWLREWWPALSREVRS